MRIVALVVQVGQAPQVVAIEPTLATLKGIVGGWLEAVRLDADTYLYCNEEGWLKNLPYNRAIGGHQIAGTFLLVGPPDDEGNETSLSPEAVKRWRERILSGTHQYLIDEEQS